MNQAFLRSLVEKDAVAIWRFSGKRVISILEWVEDDDAVCFQEILNCLFPFGCKWRFHPVAAAKLTGFANTKEVALPAFL